MKDVLELKNFEVMSLNEMESLDGGDYDAGQNLKVIATGCYVGAAVTYSQTHDVFKAIVAGMVSGVTAGVSYILNNW